MGFDFSEVVAPFRMRPGLRRLPADAQQLTPLRPGDTTLRAKLDVLSRFPAMALLCAPDADPSALWRPVAVRAAAEHADAFRMDADDAWTALALGWSVRGADVCGDGPAEIGACLRAVAPGQRLAALLALAFAEDLAVLDGANSRVPCLAVCLPSRWDPREKIGLRFADIHAPVADGAALTTAADALVRLVTSPGPRWERFVWTLSTSAGLDAHPARVQAPAWDCTASPAALAAATFFRTEHQTFGALPNHEQALFTIRVEVQPLQAALRSADDAARLQAALASMTPAVLAYRGLAPARDRLLHWLAERAGG